MGETVISTLPINVRFLLTKTPPLSLAHQALPAHWALSPGEHVPLALTFSNIQYLRVTVGSFDRHGWYNPRNRRHRTDLISPYFCRIPLYSQLLPLTTSLPPDLGNVYSFWQDTPETFQPYFVYPVAFSSMDPIPRVRRMVIEPTSLLFSKVMFLTYVWLITNESLKSTMSLTNLTVVLLTTYEL
jgi:hypothetical protein